MFYILTSEPKKIAAVFFISFTFCLPMYSAPRWLISRNMLLFLYKECTLCFTDCKFIFHFGKNPFSLSEILSQTWFLGSVKRQKKSSRAVRASAAVRFENVLNKKCYISKQFARLKQKDIFLSFLHLCHI
jgi:hypothetical protein